MKTDSNRLVRSLALIAAALALAIAAGTVYGLAAGTRERKEAREAAAAAALAEARGRTAFTGIGTLRTSSADPDPAVVVASIAFPYDAANRPYAEELSRKASALRAAAIQVLSRMKAAELAPAYEGRVKIALREVFNELLSLGEVDEVWLSDFAVLR